jgi:hypothetical protein
LFDSLIPQLSCPLPKKAGFFFAIPKTIPIFAALNNNQARQKLPCNGHFLCPKTYLRLYYFLYFFLRSRMNCCLATGNVQPFFCSVS